MKWMVCLSFSCLLKNDDMEGEYRMAEKTFNTRVIGKHDVEANWQKAVNFVPMKGEVIIYDVDDGHMYERMKIGDGVSNVNDLSFVDETHTHEKLEMINQDVRTTASPTFDVVTANKVIGAVYA